MKIIATDLDGTLFYPKDKIEMISPKNLYFLQNFIDEGNKVVIISGRSIDFGKKVINKIGRDCSIIGFNGTCVYSDNQFIEKKTMPNELVKEFIDDTFQTCKNFGVFLMTDKGVSVHLKTKSKFLRWCAKVYYKSQKIYAEQFSSLESDYEHELAYGNIYKAMLFFGISKRKMKAASEANKILRNSFENFECSWSGPVIEVTLKGCSKANALKDFIKLKNYSKDDVYVVGDSGNDISMFKEFYENSFCMEHSPKSIKKYARYTIDKFEDLSRYIYKK